MMSRGGGAESRIFRPENNLQSRPAPIFDRPNTLQTRRQPLG